MLRKKRNGKIVSALKMFIQTWNIQNQIQFSFSLDFFHWIDSLEMLEPFGCGNGKKARANFEAKSTKMLLLKKPPRPASRQIIRLANPLCKHVPSHAYWSERWFESGIINHWKFKGQISFNQLLQSAWTGSQSMIPSFGGSSFWFWRLSAAELPGACLKASSRSSATFPQSILLGCGVDAAPQTIKRRETPNDFISNLARTRKA